MTEGVKSAVRALRLMELYASAGRALTVTEAAEALALPKSSAHMLVTTLMQEGYLEPAGRDGYVLPSRLAEGWIGGQTGALIRAAAPEMDRLLETFQETVVLGVPTPALDLRIVDHRVSPLAIRYDVSRDPVLPGWGTAMGHAILSCLPEDEVSAYLARTERRPFTSRTMTDAEGILARLAHDRLRGHSENIDERIEGASGAAAPIRDAEGRPRAALNVVTLTPRYRRRRREIANALKAAARNVEAALFPPASDTSASDSAAASGD
ncbi:MAG: IclR family transcriptional regulator [Pseudomonadota bacterium]